MTEWNAPGYARVAGLQEAMVGEVLSLLDLKGTERVLDLGCGSAKVTAEIAVRVPQGDCRGVDSSADMIAFASRHFGPTVRPNLRFETGDLPSSAVSGRIRSCGLFQCAPPDTRARGKE
jgi:trans-aconitate 2-methyltransferase